MKFSGERLVPGSACLETMIAHELARLSHFRSWFEGRRILDAGCGAGYATAFVCENGAYMAVGVDLSEESICYAKTHYSRDSLVYGVMDCMRMGFVAECFDFVYSLDVIEHLADTEAYLSEIARVLRPGGVFLLSTPNRLVSSSKRSAPSWPFHVREFSASELREALASHFEKVTLWGEHVPVYEDHPVRRITGSRLSHIKHYLPARLRVGIASTIKWLIKPTLTPEDIVLTEDIESAPILVGLCQKEPGLSVLW
ncbi:MAG TPA: class I SAM-dependent methyltransferase [Anaerolineae bacterium]|nr:class I SAM-dependent methyltransferase [Anaerolineae bacterium]